MAGRGSRLRPHTLTVPKPLVPVAGKPMVQRIVEDLTASYPGKVDEIAFIIHPGFGKEVEKDLKNVAKALGTKGSIYYQTEPLGTAHAILSAKEVLSGNVIVAFADTLFKADFSINPDEDGLIWVQKVADPSAFGVVKIDEEGVITDFVEKSPVFVSDLAIVGIYYFKDGENLRKELQYLLDNDIKDKGEYQLTNALENMKQKGKKFKPMTIEEWLDCGNKDNVVYTNQRVLALKEGKEKLISDTAIIENSVIIKPCYIGDGVIIKDAVVGPFVSIGKNSKVTNSVISNSMIQMDSVITNANITNSMIGNFASYTGKPVELSIGDYSNAS